MRTGTDSIVISAEVTPTLDLGNDSTLCVGQVLSLDATFPGATYLWHDSTTTPTFNITGPDTVWVTSAIGSCTITDTLMTDYLDVVSVNLGNDTALCVGDLITLSVPDSNVTFLWHDNSTDSSLTISQTGLYWVDVTNYCGTVTDSIDIIFNPLPVIDLGNDTSICQGETLLLDAENPGGTYLWQNASVNQTFSVSQAGLYWVEVNTNNCISRDSIQVNYTPLPWLI